MGQFQVAGCCCWERQNYIALRSSEVLLSFAYESSHFYPLPLLITTVSLPSYHVPTPALNILIDGFSSNFEIEVHPSIPHLTNSIQQIPSWEATSREASQESTRLLWNPNFYSPHLKHPTTNPHSIPLKFISIILPPTQSLFT
jgi:hypothetical protein